MNLKSQNTCIDNLAKARKMYSQISKDQVKKNQELNNQQRLRQMIAKEREEIIQIEKELIECKREYNRIVQTIGQAHKEANLQQINDKQILNECNRKDYLVMSRAKQVLSNEIKKNQEIEINKNRAKEEILKKRKQLYGKSSVVLRKEAEQRYKQKLDEWTKLEDILTKKLELTRKKNMVEDKQMKLITIKSGSERKDIKKETPEGSRLKNVQIQTDNLKDDKKNGQLSSIKCIIASKVLENLQQIFSAKECEDNKLFCDMAVNTSTVPEVYDFLSETSYLSFPSEVENQTTIIEPANSDQSEEETYSFKDPELRDLIEKIKKIRSIVQNQRKNTERKMSFSKIPQENVTLVAKLDSDSALSSILDASEVPSLLSFDDCPTLSLIDQDISFSNSVQSSIDFSQFNEDFSIDKDKFVNSVLRLSEYKEPKDSQGLNNCKAFKSFEQKVCQSTPKKIT